MRIQTAVLGTILVSAASCTSNLDEGTGTFLLHDSAGVSIAESHGAAWAAGEEWSLTADPVLVLGGDIDDPDYQFFRIAGVARGSDGGMVVADRGYQLLRIYGPRGHTSKTLGGLGEDQERSSSCALSPEALEIPSSPWIWQRSRSSAPAGRF